MAFAFAQGKRVEGPAKSAAPGGDAVAATGIDIGATRTNIKRSERIGEDRGMGQGYEGTGRTGRMAE